MKARFSMRGVNVSPGRPPSSAGARGPAEEPSPPWYRRHAAIQRGMTGCNGIVTMYCQRLARSELGEGDGWVKLHLYGQAAEACHGPHMAAEVHLPKPGVERPQRATERDSVEPRVGDRHRLYLKRLAVD